MTISPSKNIVLNNVVAKGATVHAGATVDGEGVHFYTWLVRCSLHTGVIRPALLKHEKGEDGRKECVGEQLDEIEVESFELFEASIDRVASVRGWEGWANKVSLSSHY